MISDRLVQALIKVNFSERYYSLCAQYPFRKLPLCDLRAAEIKSLLNNLGNVEKLKGPADVYNLRSSDQRSNMEFSFVILSDKTTIEPCLNFSEPDGRVGTNFAVLALTANQKAGKTPPTPKYPRPFSYSTSELIEIIRGSHELALAVGLAYE